MGDEERCKEATQEGEEKEMKTVLLCPPIYPLPEEIEKMERSETVCRYCGVSYLIFHEFHQLNSRLAQLEEELQGLRETTQRVTAQREALELGRLDWEKAFHLEVQQQTAEKEKSTREALEEKHRDAERALRDEAEQKYEAERQKIKDEHQKISDDKEGQVRRELGELQAETLRKQREELERRTEEREKVLTDALQKANKNLGQLREYLQQLEERLAKASHTKEEAGQILGKAMRRGEILRGACERQQRALRATLSVLRSSGSGLTDVRGFLSQLTGVWQAFRSQILQHSTQVFSVLKHSSAELQKMREEKERLTQQLMEQRRQHEEKLSQQKDSENQHRGKLLRLKEELEEKHDRWLSCQRRCDIMQEQLSSDRAAEQEVARLREAVEKVQQEARELRREREILAESHGRALTKMEEDCRQKITSKLAAALAEQRAQNALHLREQMEELRGEVELELTIDREKNQVLLLQYQRDSTQLQEKLEEREQVLRGLQDELQEERGTTAEPASDGEKC
ncbi:leucine-, glutamate- and lysine-rich protein 1 isoform X2 [Cyclopterus lumpus]|uniref:leucine-, glutamate- and lysine-rich protein 1 isoform X2 n=1 Tax=Cyclopterus lumpus TaxID=8103 RepID=UPI001486720D|nr:leucine-, glutamate- and lysine-rich protein 1 isoform X2 [Cyclopterus lumpus]